MGEVVAHEVVESFVEAGGRIVEALEVEIGELEKKLEEERDRIADEILLGDGKVMRLFERHRAAINKQLDAELGKIRLVRELAGGSGSFCGPVLVELRVVGRRCAPRQ